MWDHCTRPPGRCAAQRSLPFPRVAHTHKAPATRRALNAEPRWMSSVSAAGGCGCSFDWNSNNVIDDGVTDLNGDHIRGRVVTARQLKDHPKCPRFGGWTSRSSCGTHVLLAPLLVIIPYRFSQIVPITRLLMTSADARGGIMGATSAAATVSVQSLRTGLPR